MEMKSNIDLENAIIDFKKDYDENGFIIIKNFFNKKFTQFTKKDLKLFLKSNSSNQNGINYINGKKKIINTAHKLKKWEPLKKIQNNELIIKIVEKILDCKIKNFGAEVFAKPAKFGLSSPIHQDNFYWNIKSNKGLTIWIALDNVNKKNGSLYYYKKSHKLGLLPHEPSYVPGSSQTISKLKLKKLKKYKKVFTELKVGDAILHSSLVVHGSNKNPSKNNRMAFTLRYVPQDSKFNILKKKKYEKNLLNQKKLLANARL
jgi:ectoine hydroxylase-related dioxygenase (phytanoyl-CoA dioxygenase family)